MKKLGEYFVTVFYRVLNEIVFESDSNNNKKVCSSHYWKPEKGSKQTEFTGFLQSPEDSTDAKDFHFAVVPIISSAHQANFHRGEGKQENWARLSIFLSVQIKWNANALERQGFRLKSNYELVHAVSIVLERHLMNFWQREGCVVRLKGNW